MSTTAKAKVAPRGAIRDQGYQRYQGGYTPDRGRWKLIAGRMTKMTARQPWVLVMLILAIFPALIAGVLMYIAAKMYAAGMAPAKPDSLVFEYLCGSKVEVLLTFLTALFAGGGAVADDARGGAFQFYFARPISREQYLAGKLLPPIVLTACVSMVPATLLAFLRLALAKDGADALESILLPAQALGAGALIAVALGTASVALSSLTKSRGLAQGAFAGLFLLPWILGAIFVGVTRSPWPAIFSIPTHLANVGRLLFRQPLSPDEHAMPVWVSAALLAALIAGSIALLRKRLASVEVIGG